MDKAAESSSTKSLQKLINLILQSFFLSRKEAHEALLKVKEKNGGVLKGLRRRKFIRMVGQVNREKNLKEKQKEREQKQEMRGTCWYCYQVLFDDQARDRHIKNVHSDQCIEEEVETGNKERKIEEGGEDIWGIASLLLDDILDKVVKKSKTSSCHKCPECDKIFSHKISMQRHFKQHAKDLSYFQCDECDFKTLRSDNLKKHRRNIHNVFKTNFKVLRDKSTNLNYSCKMCGEEFLEADFFETHLVMKACQNPADPIDEYGRYQCDLCTSSYSNKWDLSRHMEWKHKPSHVFSCELCNKTFYNQYSLKRHVKNMHNSEKTEG